MFREVLMKKAMRVISIAMPFVVLALLFVPFLSHGQSNTPNNILLISLFSCFTDNGDAVSQSCIIFFFTIAIAISITGAFLFKKSPVFACLNFFSCAYLLITTGTIFVLAERSEYLIIKLHAAFYISLILSAFFLAVFIAYAVKWLKSRLDSRPPREHKPTKAERIAELEARVRELENRD